MADKPLEKTITVAGKGLKKRDLLVFKATFEANLMRIAAISTAMAGSVASDDFLTNARNAFMNVTYNNLKACTEGNLPSAVQCLKMYDTDLQTWIDTAKELNSGWFPKDEVETPEKKEQPS